MFKTTEKILNQLVDVVHGTSNKHVQSRTPKLQEKQRDLTCDKEAMTSQMKPKHMIFRNGTKKTCFSVPKLPLDRDFTFGCNADVCKDMNMDEELTQMAEMEQLWSGPHRQAKLDLAHVCSNETPLKQTPLPTTTFWNGESVGILTFDWL